MANITETLANFDPSKAEKYDPGKIVILFDNRIAKTEDDKFSYFQSYWTESLYKLGWPSLYRPNLDPGNIRLVWYTVSAQQPKNALMRDGVKSLLVRLKSSR